MLFKQEHWAGLTDGTITLAFRKWNRANAKAGRRVRFAGGHLMIDDVRIVDEAKLTKPDATRAGFASVAALARTACRVRRRRPVSHRAALGRCPTSASPSAKTMTCRTRRSRQSALRLAKLDKASTRGPWTATVLQLIAERPAVRAPDLAASLGLETLVFKRDVRKLKALGLTESLKVGYRISPRGLRVGQTAPP